MYMLTPYPQELFKKLSNKNKKKPKNKNQIANKSDN